MWPPPEEVAELTINGARYTDWESVMVKHQFNEQPPYIFRFTCSEGMPLESSIWALRIRPGDYCTIKLAGILAFSGYVHTRQVFYDAKRHHIEIQGASLLEMSIASVITKKQEFTNKSKEEVSRAILNSLGINMVVEGGSLPKDKIPRISVPPSISLYEFMDHLWRDGSSDSTNGINFSANPNGDFVIVVGDTGGSDTVKEGDNILEARCLIYNHLMVGGKASIVGQRPGNDQVHGPAASIKYLKGTMQSMGLTLPTVVVNENATWSMKQLQDRNNSQSRWNKDDQITVHITVRGWLRPSGGLWYRGQKVKVISPMLIMPDETLTLKSAMFTQDNTTGTRTILDLRNDKALGPTQPTM